MELLHGDKRISLEPRVHPAHRTEALVQSVTAPGGHRAAAYELPDVTYRADLRGGGGSAPFTARSARGGKKMQLRRRGGRGKMKPASCTFTVAQRSTLQSRLHGPAGAGCFGVTAGFGSESPKRDRPYPAMQRCNEIHRLQCDLVLNDCHE